MSELIVVFAVVAIVFFVIFPVYFILIGAQECYECGVRLNGNFMLNEDRKRVCSLMCGTKYFDLGGDKDEA